MRHIACEDIKNKCSNYQCGELDSPVGRKDQNYFSFSPKAQGALGPRRERKVKSRKQLNHRRHFISIGDTHTYTHIYINDYYDHQTIS